MAGTYDQFCAVASALDVLGDRWTLLIVRELLAGPRRNGELVQDLPGIATNLLADRLRKLEAAGLVEPVREHADSDGRTRTYRLTDGGRQGLLPVVEALARFGLALLPDDAAGRAFRPQWFELAVGLLARPGAVDRDLVVRFEVAVEDEVTPVQLRLGPDGARADPDAEPDVVLGGSPGALLGALRDADHGQRRVEAGELRVRGDREARRQLAAALGGDGAAGREGWTGADPATPDPVAGKLPAGCLARRPGPSHAGPGSATADPTRRRSTA